MRHSLAKWTADSSRRFADEVDQTPVRQYLTSMRTMISSKGQIVLPAELRQQDRIRPGEQFDVERLAAGHYLLTKVAGPGETGLLDWLRPVRNGNGFVRCLRNRPKKSERSPQ